MKGSLIDIMEPEKKKKKKQSISGYLTKVVGMKVFENNLECEDSRGCCEELHRGYLYKSGSDPFVYP